MGSHACQHCHDKQYCISVPDDRIHHRRSGAKPRHAPADPEQKTTDNQSAIDLTGGGQAHGFTPPTGLPMTRNGKGNDGDADGARHHQNQGGIPSSCQVEEAQHIEAVAIPFDAFGAHDMDWLEAQLHEDQKAGRKALVSLMHANNEIGNLADLERLSRMTRAYGALLHSDTVQTMAHLKLDFAATPLEFAACSAHKFHGPKGVGFAYIKQGTGVQPFIRGGAQERGHRAGTENVVGIAGLGAAFATAIAKLEEDAAHMTDVKAYAIERLRTAYPHVHFNGHSGDLEKSLFTVLNFYVPELHDSGMLNFQLDLQGFCVSGGSACSSGAVGGSHVLGGLKSPGGTRISFSRMTTRADIDAFVNALQKLPKLD